MNEQNIPRQQRHLQTSVGGVTFQNESVVKSKQSQYSFNRSKQIAQVPYEQEIGQPNKLKAFSLYPFSDNDRIQKNEIPSHVVFHVRGRSAIQYSWLCKYVTICAIFIVLTVIGVCLWMRGQRVADVNRETGRVGSGIVEPIVDTTKVIKKNWQQKKVGAAPKDTSQIIVQPIIDNTKVPYSNISTEKIKHIHPKSQRDLTPTPKLIAVVSPVKPEQIVKPIEQDEPLKPTIIEKQQKTEMKQKQKILPIVTTSVVQDTEDEETKASSTQKPDSSDKSIKIAKVEQENKLKEPQSDDSSASQKLKNKNPKAEQSNTLISAKSIVKINSKYFQCPPPAFIYRSSCIKCPQNSTWNGTNCLINTFPFKANLL